MKKFAVIFLSLVGAAAAGTTIRGAELPSQEIQVSITNGTNGRHALRGEFMVSASSAAVWAVLTDYNRMPTFVSGMNYSHTVSVAKDGATIEQVMTGKAGFFQKRIFVRLEVFEQPTQLITFQDVSRRSFQYYVGSWRIQNHDTKSEVIYQLEAVPNFFSPDFIAVGAFRRSVKLLLEQVRAEILRRETARLTVSTNPS